MINSIILEFYKLKRDRSFIVMTVVLVLFPVFILVSLGARKGGAVDWDYYLLHSQPPMYYCTFLFLIVTASSVFAKEYRLRTISVLFTTPNSRVRIYLAKTAALLMILAGAVFLTGIVNLLVGRAVVRRTIGSGELGRYLGVMLLSVSFYFALVPAAALLSIATGKAALAAILYFSFTIFTFPFSFQAAYLPPLLPVHLAVRLIDTGKYPVSSVFCNPDLDPGVAALSMVLFFLLPFVFGLFFIKNRDVNV